MQTGAQVANDAVQGILSRIDQLASKIGTTAAHVWDVYVGQARVEAIRDGVVGAILFLGSLLFFWVFFHCDDEDAKIGCFLVAVAAGIASLIWFYGSAGEWLNPQYWAFQHLTQDLKNLF